MEESTIIDQIHSFIENNTKLPRHCKLYFTYEGRPPSTTSFTYKKSNEKNTNGSYANELLNDCVRIVITNDKMLLTDLSLIIANTRDPACFTPRLVSDPRNQKDRISAVDILQTLKTKLSIVCSPHQEITIIDQAESNGKLVTPHRILRGGDGFYEKFGYTSANIDTVKEALKTFRFSELVDEENTYETLKAIYEVLDLGELDKLPPEHLLVDTMKKIPWNINSEQLRKIKGIFPTSSFLIPYLDDIILSFVGIKIGLIKDYEVTKENTTIFREFKLDKNSPGWTAYNSKLVFTNFKVITAGGSRSKRTRRVRKGKSRQPLFLK